MTAHVGAAHVGAMYLSLLGHRPEWFDQAACASAGTLTPLFYPDNSFHRNVVAEDRAQAMAICETCPVRVECLNYALDLPQNLDWGIWGGTLEGQRRKIRDRRRIAAQH